MLIINSGHFFNKYIDKINICKTKEDINELETEIKKVFHDLMDSKTLPEEKEKYALAYHALLNALRCRKWTR